MGITLRPASYSSLTSHLATSTMETSRRMPDEHDRSGYIMQVIMAAASSSPQNDDRFRSQPRVDNKDVEQHSNPHGLTAHGLTTNPSAQKRRSHGFSSMQSYDVRGEFPCDFDGCAGTFKQKKNMLAHKRAVHGTTKFACDICDASFAAQSYLTQHQREVHGDEQQFGCDQCDMSFKAQRYVKAHKKRVHQKTLSCDVCGKRFGIRYDLTKHLKTLHAAPDLPSIRRVLGIPMSSSDSRTPNGATMSSSDSGTLNVATMSSSDSVGKDDDPPILPAISENFIDALLNQLNPNPAEFLPAKALYDELLSLVNL